MILLNPQLNQFKKGDTFTVDSMEQAYPLLYAEVERQRNFGYVKEIEKVRDIAVVFDENGENIIVQTELKDINQIRKAVEKFIQSNIIRYEAEQKKVETRLKTLYEAKG